MQENFITTDGLIGFGIGLLIFIVLVFVWFIPVICSKNNKNHKSILLVCIFLGWIPLVWLVLLLAALLGEKNN